MTREVFTVEDENGEMLDNIGDGGFSVFLTREDARDAADSEEDSRDDGSKLTVVRFVRDSQDGADAK